MADDAVEAAGESRGGPEGAPTGPSDIARRARLWYLEAVNHPFWKDYRANAKEDEGFYVGGKGQWSLDYSSERYEKLKAQGRAVISIDHIGPAVELLVGLERQNRYDIKAAPEGAEDVEDTETLSWLLKWAQDQAEVHERLSDGAEDVFITGLAAWTCEIDWSEDPWRGEIVVERLEPGKDCLWDPSARKMNLRDARYFLRFRWVQLEDVIADHPDKKDAIRAAAADLEMRSQPGGGKSTSGPAADAYGAPGSHPQEALGPDAHLWDPLLRRVLVLEPWWREPEDLWFVVDRSGGRPVDKDAQGTPLSHEAATLLAASDPDTLRAVRRRVMRVHTATVLPAFFMELEPADPTPYDNDDRDFPFVACWGYRRGDAVWGVVSKLKDPQRAENKRWSQALDLLGKYANLRLMYREGSVVDPRTLEEPFSSAPIVLNQDATLPEPKYLIPPLAEVARLLSEMAQQMAQKMREIGPNTELLGLRGDSVSGVAIAERKQQGNILYARLYDNLRQARHIMGQRLARRVQQRFTTEEVIRLTRPDTGEAVVVRVNPSEARRKEWKDEDLTFWRSFRARQLEEGRPRVLRDPSALKFDVAIGEIPATPTARAAKALALIEVAEKFPATQPVLLPEIMEMLDIPNRSRVLQRMAALTGQNGGATGAGGPPGGALPPEIAAALAGGGGAPAPGGPPVVPPTVQGGPA